MAGSSCRLGVDYFPEHWPEERWPRDVALMREAGLQVVRIAEFTWSKTQPGPGRWQWDWLDRAVEVIAEAGLQVVLCTPTACPPPWMTQVDPSILPVVDRSGQRVPLLPGGRRHYSPHHAGYRQAAAEIAGRLAERYGKHEAVIAYQIDNEILGGVDDHGPLAVAAFQQWLAERHGDVATLNERLGTIFWGQQWSAFAEIPTPLGRRMHPGLELEFRRFSTAAWVAFCRNQAEAMRPHMGPGQLLTTNCYLPYWNMLIDWAALMQEGGLDVFAFDNYCRSEAEGAFYNDLARSLQGRYWILEQACGATGGQHLWPDRADRIALDTGMAQRKGAELITYFRWRQGLFGKEQDHGAVLDHHGEPGPIYAELQRVAATTAAARPASPRPRLGISFRWEDHWYAERTTPPIDYETWQRASLAQAAATMGEDVRYCFRPEDCAQVDLLLLPFLQAHDPDWEQAILDALAAGTTVCAMPLFFAKDRWGSYRTDYLPPAIAAAFGIAILRRIPLRQRWHDDDVIVDCSIAGGSGRALHRVDEVDCREAEVSARFSDGPIPGAPLLTERRHAGGGRALFCATYPDAAGCLALLQSIAGTDEGEMTVVR